MICLSADNKKWLTTVFNAVVCRLGVSASIMRKVITITQYSLLISNLFLLTACSSSSTDDDGIEKPMLKIYLFAPESPIVTRAFNGYVDASEAERAIHTIDVWVFQHEAPNDKVSYIHLDDLTFTGQREISMEISDDFANMPKKPNVDIYVVANKESMTGTELDENTTLAQLKEKCIGSSAFGTTSPVSTVLATGLPMSGLLENQVITGIPPVYTAKANYVKLVRAVSKVRFILSKSNADPPAVSNLSIQLNDNMLPKEEYVFLEGTYPENKCHVKTGVNAYEAAVTLVSGLDIKDINGCDNPLYYDYGSQTGQDYEDLINSGLVDPDGEGEQHPALSQVGLFYFHESDKQLEGKIEYKLGTAPNIVDRSVSFSMGAEGDFTRNHTWIVYGYFLGSGELKLNVVDIKNWTTGSEDLKVYNW